MKERTEKNDTIEFVVDSMGMDGEGVGHCFGKAVFVRGALPGERVRAKIIAVKPRYDFALLEKVLVPSDERVAPSCPVFGKCGGCDLRHLSYPAQLAFKREQVASTLKKAGVVCPVSETVPSPKVDRYRNKVSVPVRRTAIGGTAIGLFARNSHRVVETSDCLLQYEWMPALVSAVREFMADSGLTGYDESDGSGDVREIAAREEGGATAVALVATRPLPLNGLLPRLNEILPRAELWLNVNSARNNVIFGDEWRRVGGDSGKIEVDGFKLTLHPAGFFQVNDDVRKLLYDRAASLFRGKCAIEAYSGAGLLAARLAREAKAAYGIEINREAHAAALALKADNGITNFHPIEGDAEKVLPELLNKLRGEYAPDEIGLILDPPRAGITEAVARTLNASGIKRVAYIGCNPATLARDAARLQEGGFVALEALPFDMFPMTANIETLLTFKRK